MTNYPYQDQFLAMRDDLAERFFESTLYFDYWDSGAPACPKGEGIYVFLEHDATPFYVGKTRNFRRRLNEHRQTNFYVRRCCTPAYAYYFAADRVTDCTLDLAEKYYIEQLDPWVNRRDGLRCVHEFSEYMVIRAAGRPGFNPTETEIRKLIRCAIQAHTLFRQFRHEQLARIEKL